MTGKSIQEIEDLWKENAEENAKIIATHPEWFDGTWVPGTGNSSYGLTIEECQERDMAMKKLTKLGYSVEVERTEP